MNDHGTKFMVNKQKYFMAIIFTQILLIVFWVSRQGSLYWDAYYTFENAHYVSASTSSNHYINSDSEFEMNKWIDSAYVKDTLYVDFDESVLADAPQESGKILLKKPYFWMLNMIEALLSSGHISRWPGVFLNIILFIIVQVLLYKSVRRLSKDANQALLAVSIYGFCGMALSMTTYVRFYVFSTMLLMAVVYLHICMWEDENARWYKLLLFEAISLLLIYWGMSITQLTLFFYASFIFIYNIALLIKKRYKEFALYVLPVGIGGLFYLVKYTDYMYILLNPQEAAGKLEGPALWVVESLLSITPVSLIDRLAHTFLYMGKYGFGYWPVFLLFILVIVAIVIKHKKITFIHSTMEWILFIEFIVFMLIATCLNFYVQTRYTSYIYPILAWLISAVLVSVVNDYGLKYAQILGTVLIGSILISTVSGKRVDFVFEQDREPLSRIEASGVKDVVVLQIDLYNRDAEIIYDVAHHTSDDARLLPVLEDDIEKMQGMYPDEFIMANISEYDKSDRFVKMGYEIEWKEETYFYSYYLMKKADS